MTNLRRIILMTLFSVLIFIPKLLLPTPLDKLLFIIQALVLGLGALLLGKLGATYTSFIGGLLTTILRPTFFPLSLLFAVLYGVLIDVFFNVLRVKTSSTLRNSRVIISMTLSTMLTGLITYYITAHSLGLLPRNILIEAAILVVGTLSGAIGGWLITYLWRKGIHNYV